MASTTMPATFALPRRTPGEWIALFALEAKYEILKYVRLPIFAISTLMFPTMFYVLFGIVLPNGTNRTETATYLLATMACYGVMGVAMFSFGVGIAMERGQGWLQVKRASPMPLPGVLPGQDCERDGIRHCDLVAAAGRRRGLWRSTHAAAHGIEADHDPRARFNSLQRDGTGARILRQAELLTSDG
jgi:hypothetical protein